MNANQQQRVKLLSAVIGASAVVAMGALGVIFGDVSSAQPAQVGGPVAPQASEQTVIGDLTSSLTATFSYRKSADRRDAIPRIPQRIERF